MYLVRPESLCTGAFLETGGEPCLVRQQPGVRNHDSVVDAEALVGRVDAASALAGHEAHHLLDALVAAHAADDQDLVAADVGHGPLRDLDEHGEDGFL